MSTLGLQGGWWLIHRMTQQFKFLKDIYRKGLAVYSLTKPFKTAKKNKKGTMV
jgi:hypothetical protein